MQYAYFDPITRQVIGWFDTDAFDCVLPSAELLLELSPDDWKHNVEQPRWVTEGLSLSQSEPYQSVTLEKVKAAKIAEISNACAAEIVGGFVSSALGALHTYPSEATDQSNLMAAVLSSLSAPTDGWETPIKCTDSQGISAYRQHTAEQTQAVGNDSLNARNAALAKKADLQTKISQAVIIEQVTKLNWAAR